MTDPQDGRQPGSASTDDATRREVLGSSDPSGRDAAPLHDDAAGGPGRTADGTGDPAGTGSAGEGTGTAPERSSEAGAAG